MNSRFDRVRVLTIFSDLEHSKTFELTAKHLDLTRFDVRALFLNPPRAGAVPLEQYFTSIGIPTPRLDRSVESIDNSAIFKPS